MPYIFSDEDLERLSEKLAIVLLPKLLSAMKSKSEWAVNRLQGEYYTAAELSDMLSVSKQKIYRMASDGSLPCIHVGKGGVRFERHVIDQARQEGRI